MIRKMKSERHAHRPDEGGEARRGRHQALTVDSKIDNIKKLASLGQEVGKVKTKNITFTTVPVVDNTDGATVLPTPPEGASSSSRRSGTTSRSPR